MSDELKPRLKPLFLVKPKTMSPRDIRRAETRCGIVIAECADPEAARFLDVPPDAGLDAQARAALSLMRVVLSSQTSNYPKAWLVEWFTHHLMNSGRLEEVKRVKK